jgi:hypothetical protein
MKPPYASLLLVLLGVSPAAGQSFTEFPVTTLGAGPAGITSGPDGNVWFTEYRIISNKISRSRRRSLVRVPSAPPIRIPEPARLDTI